MLPMTTGYVWYEIKWEWEELQNAHFGAVAANWALRT